MAIHCYGEEVKDVNIVSGSVNIGSAGGERIPVDVSINKQSSQRAVEDNLVLSVALQLYSNSDFDSIKNLSKHAGLCLERANTFSEVYAKFKSKEAIVDASRVTDVKLYVQYKPGDSYVDVTIVDVSERFMYELSKDGVFLLGFETYNKFGHKCGQRIKYKILKPDGTGEPKSNDGLTICDNYITFTSECFYNDVLNKTFSLTIPDVWNVRAYSEARDNIMGDETPWVYKPIQIRPTFRSMRTGWQRANLNIINYKWLTFQYPSN